MLAVNGIYKLFYVFFPVSFSVICTACKICWSIYSKTLLTRTPMARLPRLSKSFFLSLRNSSYSSRKHITKTCLYNFDPIVPHFYIVKLEFTGVYIIFSYFCIKIYIVGTRKNRLTEAVLKSTPNICFEEKYEKIQGFFIWKFSVFRGYIFIYLNRRVFVMKYLKKS